jgi:hypothetical protein
MLTDTEAGKKNSAAFDKKTPVPVGRCAATSLFRLLLSTLLASLSRTRLLLLDLLLKKSYF